ncbi:Protein ABIL3, partial [Linum perenne]
FQQCSSKVCYFLPRVIETCKDYTIKALINTVDHLGSVAFKLNSYIDHTTCEVASMDLRVYTMDQVIHYPFFSLYKAADFLMLGNSHPSCDLIQC